MAELGNPKNTIEVLQKYQFHFAKKFGQNFLIDTHVLDKIVRAAEITPEDYVLEIGPGIGTLTQYPVSYTHLDVYKRQLVSNIICDSPHFFPVELLCV